MLNNLYKLEGKFFLKSVDECLNIENMSICRFLHKLSIDDIARRIECIAYSNDTYRIKYKIQSMIKLFIVMCFRQISYEKTIASLTDEEAILLSFYDSNMNIKLPSPKTLHHFVKYRLGEDNLKDIMSIVGEKILYYSKIREAKIDSTPLEASRYDKYSKFNPHYQCKMDKAHITMIGTYPIFMTYTDGNAGDSPELIKHIKALKEMKADIDFYSADGAYDSFYNHANIWYHLDAKPIISYSADAVTNKEGTIERIDHWINKMWKKRSDLSAGIERKLKFLYKNGRIDQVGMYLRNQNIHNENFKEAFSSRRECEPIHKHIKEVVKFDVRKIRAKSRELYMLLSFVAYQMLVLMEIQSQSTNKNTFGKFY